MADEISQKLTSIQSQLAKLQTDYTSMATAMYDKFFNTEAKDVTLRLYDDNGRLVDVTIPNRAKDATDKVLSGYGDPNVLEVSAKQLGVLYIDRDTATLYYYTVDGWVQVWSAVNFEKGLDYLSPTGDASSLINLNMKNAIRGSYLPVASGGTGVGNFGDKECVVKVVPAVIEDGEEITPAYFAPATSGTDFISPDSFVGMVCFSLSSTIPEGYLACDGAKYLVKYYPKLYEYLNKTIGTEASVNEDGDLVFDVPDLRGYYPYFTNLSERETLDKQEPALPNIKGQWVQEITGAETYFKDAVYIPTESGKPIQVSGKTSAPGGYYDYLVRFDASKYNDLYSDDVDDVRVRNVALLPIIKY